MTYMEMQEENNVSGLHGMLNKSSYRGMHIATCGVVQAKDMCNV
jgi:hypothetical protein